MYSFHKRNISNLENSLKYSQDGAILELNKSLQNRTMIINKMNNDIAKNKYLKYKNKYINLKYKQKQ